MTTVNEILEYAKNYGGNKYSPSTQMFFESIDILEYKNGAKDFGGLGTVQYVDGFGGEDLGSHYWIVFKLHDKLFKAVGHYDSWDGVDWDDVSLTEVMPVEKVLITTVYEEIK